MGVTSDATRFRSGTLPTVTLPEVVGDDGAENVNGAFVPVVLLEAPKTNGLFASPLLPPAAGVPNVNCG